jgi:hypothetical protein
MLGHTSAKVTLDTYADLFDDDLDAVAVTVPGPHPPGARRLHLMSQPQDFALNRGDTGTAHSHRPDATAGA